MKALCLLRHAKSSWKYPELQDFERPLSRRGNRDAPLMGSILNKRKFYPDLILSSPATRAAVTARIIAEMLRQPEDKISFSNLLYATTPETIINVIQSIENRVEKLLLVGHNPELTSLANILADHTISNIPTCGIYCMELEISSWSKLSEKCGRFIFFEHPKKFYSDPE